jgi:hypothetical protein
LCQKEKEQDSGEKLGAAEALAREKSGHKSGTKCFTMRRAVCGNLRGSREKDKSVNHEGHEVARRFGRWDWSDEE